MYIVKCAIHCQQYCSVGKYSKPCSLKHTCISLQCHRSEASNESYQATAKMPSKDLFLSESSARLPMSLPSPSSRCHSFILLCRGPFCLKARNTTPNLSHPEVFLILPSSYWSPIARKYFICIRTYMDPFGSLKTSSP